MNVFQKKYKIAVRWHIRHSKIFFLLAPIAQLTVVAKVKVAKALQQKKLSTIVGSFFMPKTRQSERDLVKREKQGRLQTTTKFNFAERYACNYDFLKNVFNKEDIEQTVVCSE